MKTRETWTATTRGRPINRSIIPVFENILNAMINMETESPNGNHCNG